MIHKIKHIFDAAYQYNLNPYFGFVYGDYHLSNNELCDIKKLVGHQSAEVVSDFESAFAGLVGNGEAVSYAAARMGFYDLMRIQGISQGDEVILLGSTCAVMANAVLRIGATPVYSDIDSETFGSSCSAIEKCITTKTRMIVAQHSFGIPCDIQPIAELAKKHSIFLLEDCALTLGSTVNGITVGNFGHAALFSTDHSKPLSTLIGGLVYTRSVELAAQLRSSQLGMSDLSLSRQLALWRRFLIEKNYCFPESYGRLRLIDILESIKKKLTSRESDFLSDDFGISNQSSYPYPAKLPAFLAAIGLHEITRWPSIMSYRKELLQALKSVVSSGESSSFLPKAYDNKRLSIIPLRFVWTEPNADVIRESLSHFIKVDWTWFMQPVIATKQPLIDFGYRDGACPVSERVGPGMINIPCNIPMVSQNQLLNLVQKSVK